MVFLGVLVKTPFKQFNKAKGKDGYLSKHGSLQYHHDAIVATKAAFLKNFNQPDHRIKNIIEKKRKERSERNKHILCAIVECIKLCGMHDIPLQRHRDDSTAFSIKNRGNFMALVEYAAKYDTILQQHLSEEKRNQKYTSKTIY